MGVLDEVKDTNAQSSAEKSVTQSMKSLVFEDEDLPYEEDILRNEFSLRSWQRYIDHKIKTKAPSKQVRIIYERALKIFNRSYKLWYNYLKYRRRIIQQKSPTDVAYSYLCDAYERCLVFLNKMPRIWIDYCDLMVKRGLITETRRVFDRAIRALPVTQHMRIWPAYIEFVTSHNIPDTTIRVYRRYLKINPAAREDFVDYLKGIDKLDEAANQLALLVNEDKDVSEHGKSSFQLWTELCELISKNPNKVFSLSVEPIIRQGIQRYSDQVGVLWLALAEYYNRKPNWERARDIYEEALVKVVTVRDFTQIFDAYAKFMERLTSNKMNALQKAKAHEIDDLEFELELFINRFEHLMERRPLLLNSVLLRQNPNNVREWINRIQLYDGFFDEQVETFEKAVKTVDPKQQTGNLSDLWTYFAGLLERNEKIQETKKIFERAVVVPFAKVDELAQVWCKYVEFELLHRDYDAAIYLLKRATDQPKKKVQYFDETEKVQKRVYKSLRVWSLYADIEESLGTVETCRKVYERIIELRIATPQIVINFARFLEENHYFEESFKAYEKGIGLFRWPMVYDIWNVYLAKFTVRYGGKKLERARDLFEQCLENCPPKFAKGIYLLYAKLEEECGLARHAMAIYSRAAKSVEETDMLVVYNIYLKKAIEFFGITSSRPIFQEAIEALPEDSSREMSLKFAQVERNLGEIDRARAIYAHCAEICDPRVHGQFWETWKEFEVAHGNEDTLREMLRVKRSVQASYNINVNYMSAQMLATIGGKAEKAGELSAADSMAVLEARAQQIAAEENTKRRPADVRPISFVRGDIKTVTENVTENPDEIDINIEEDDEEEAE
ncbi:unnamed protein product [Bursaphelenchus xylophilus]|uniref:(pine wood nematode) hypothetical protein n=1 Tax=Bursaphelenchus xylophilus TaxID=6326 RepID=A0A1I7S0B5_BURXY|nr:unnamed protein product [Bursaphelenchus xylophilus]CAG9132179.1 unnamed protein product [Bursaphelenchus xylophilus]